MSTKERQRLGSIVACVVRGVQATEKLTRFLTVHDEGHVYQIDCILEITGSEVSRMLHHLRKLATYLQDRPFKIPESLVRRKDGGLPRGYLDHIEGYT